MHNWQTDAYRREHDWFVEVRTYWSFSARREAAAFTHLDTSRCIWTALYETSKRTRVSMYLYQSSTGVQNPCFCYTCYTLWWFEPMPSLPYLRRLAIYANGCKWWGSRLWHRPSHPFHPILSSSVIQEMITRPHGRRLHCSRTCMDPNRISAGIFHLGGKVGRKSVQVF